MDQRDLAAKVFGSTAAQYLRSTVHASGADLDRLADLVRKTPVSSALDLGCGAGHASFALAGGGAERVIAYDISTQMLDVVVGAAQARGYRQIETCGGSAERLPFHEASFDMVVTRYSAHHWLDVQRAMGEVGRVLKPGGLFVAIDVLAPEIPLLDTALQTIELLRDPSHVRNYRESEWHAMLAAANLPKPDADRWKLVMEFDAWVRRIGTSDARIAALKVVFDEFPREVREYFAVGQERSFAIDAGWFAARLQSPTI
ncbi:MAG: class I SAM-dependent methyltransferase [Steroidobacteraceae bacterium]